MSYIIFRSGIMAFCSVVCLRSILSDYLLFCVSLIQWFIQRSIGVVVAVLGIISPTGYMSNISQD